jgi:uncharacterized membrane protein
MRLKIFFVFALFLTRAFSLRAEERILNFESDIKINADASLDVTETIKVVCEGNRIRHGIYRDFPTRYRDHFGNNYKVDFNLLSVLRDGSPENFHIDNTLHGKRVYIGSKDRLLENGEYTYSLVYHTTRQLGFFKDNDELYWNVTGNDWEFAIDKAKALVHLPPGARLLSRGAFVGVKGARGQDFIVKQNGDAVLFEASRPLYRNEGLTIYVDWPKGFVTVPTTRDKFIYLLKDNASILAGLIGIMILFLYYFFMWVKVGKDPAQGTIIPLYEPPKEFSPAACRYLLKMDYDNKDFACALVDMAVKGYLTIEEDEGGYILKKTGANTENLSADESAIADTLFRLSDAIALEQENHTRVQKALAAFKRVLQANIETTYFLSNKEYFIPGAVLSVAVIAVSASLSAGSKLPIALFMSVWLSIWSIGVFALISQVVMLWKGAAKSGAKAIGAMGLTVFSIPFILGEAFGIGMFCYATSAVVVLVLAVAVAMDIIFYHLLKAPTMRGRAMLDKIEGFKLYINTAEKDTIEYEIKNKSPQGFEKYLPYAMALDVEKVWSDKFAAALSTGSQGYTPGWYHGSNFTTLGVAGFCTGLGVSLASAVTTSAMAPGSSGAGGSSGGGGGGGGGGGW